MVVKETLVVLGNLRPNLVHVLLEVVENRLHHLAILHRAVELVEHLVRIVDRGDGLVRPGVAHSGPGVSVLWNHDTKFERAKAGLRGSTLLKVVLDFLIN